jgi:hypothetical protein
VSTESSTSGGTSDDAKQTSQNVETVFDNVDGVDIQFFLDGDSGGVIDGCGKEVKRGGMCERKEDIRIM